MRSRNEQVRLRVSIGVAFGLFVVTLSLFYLGFWRVFQAGTFDQLDYFARSRYFGGVVLGIAGPVLFVLALYSVYIRKASLIFDRAGVVDTISKAKLGRISWREIEDVELERHILGSAVRLYLKADSPHRRKLGGEGVVLASLLALSPQQAGRIRYLFEVSRDTAR